MARTTGFGVTATIAVLGLLVQPVFSQKLEEIISAYLQRVGGEEAIRNLKTVEETVEIQLNMDLHNTSLGTVSIIGNQLPTVHKRLKKGSAFQRDEIYKDGALLSASFTNGLRNGMLIDGRFVDDPYPHYVTLHMAANLMAAFSLNQLKLVGPRTFSGRDCVVIEGPYYPGGPDNFLYFLDKETHLLIGYTGLDKPDVAVSFSDHQLIGGILTPFVRESRYQGVLFSREVITSIEYNSHIDDAAFFYSEK
jgi:hypothetical protein